MTDVQAADAPQLCLDGVDPQFDVSHSGLVERCACIGFDTFCEELTDVFYPVEVTPLSRPVSLLAESRLTEARLGHLTLGSVHFGVVDTRLDAGELGTYHVNIPLSGFVESRCGAREAVILPGKAAVFTPREHTVLTRWSSEATQLCVKISRAALEDELSALIARPVPSWVRFDLEMDVTGGPGRSWLSVLQLLISELSNPGSMYRRSKRHAEYLERLVISGLLATQQHNYYEQLVESAWPARPRTIKRVIDAIEESPERHWSLADMARIAGVSGRRLQKGFADHLAVTPTAYLTSVRLQHARDDLICGTSCVAEVAYRWGFSNQGRFAHLYRQRYEELPSETLRRTSSLL